MGAHCLDRAGVYGPHDYFGVAAAIAHGFLLAILDADLQRDRTCLIICPNHQHIEMFQFAFPNI